MFCKLIKFLMKKFKFDILKFKIFQITFIKSYSLKVFQEYQKHARIPQ
jgi:hypothetical protein